LVFGSPVAFLRSGSTGGERGGAFESGPDRRLGTLVPFHGVHGITESVSVCTIPVCLRRLNRFRVVMRVCVIFVLVVQVALKIIKHCKECMPALVTGQLLGLDIGSILEVTNCFPIPVCLFQFRFFFEAVWCIFEIYPRKDI